MVLPAPEQALLQKRVHALKDHIIDVFPLRQLATARINQTEFTYPLGELTVDTTSADWLDGRNGMKVSILDDATGQVIFDGVLRKNNDADTVYISGVVAGDTGLAAEIQPSFVDNLLVVVYDVRTFWSFPSIIRDGVFYKAWDDVFDSTSTYPRPVVMMGGHRQRRTSGVTVTEELDGSGSYVLYDPDDTSMLEYLWELPDNVLLVGGYSLTDATIEVTAQEGAHILELRVEDTDQDTNERGYRYLMVYGSIYKPLSEQYPIQILSDESDLIGDIVTLRVYTREGIEKFYPGAPVFIRRQPGFSDGVGDPLQSPTEGTFAEQYFGMVRRFSAVQVDEEGVEYCDIETLSPLHYFRSLRIADQVLTETAVPTNWQEVPTFTNNLAYACWYLIRFHTRTLQQLCDLELREFSTMVNDVWTVRARDVTSGLQSLARQIGVGTIGCDGDGTVRLRRIPHYEKNSYRGSLPVVYRFEEGELQLPLNYSRDPIMRVGTTTGAGFIYNASTDPKKSGAAARMGLSAPMQGTNDYTMSDFIAEDVDDVRRRVGNEHARQNAPTPQIPLRLSGIYDFVQPSKVLWYELDLSAIDPLGTLGVLNNPASSIVRAIATRVSRRWEYDDGEALLSEMSVTFEPETFGQLAEVLPLSPSGWRDDPIVYDPPDPDDDDVTSLLVISTTGMGARTFTLDTASPVWQDLTSTVEGALNAMCPAYALGWFEDSARVMLAVTIENTALRIWKVPDIRASVVVWELVKTITMTDEETTTSAMIAASKTTDVAAVTWRTSTRIYCARSGDGGESWDSGIAVGSAYGYPQEQLLNTDLGLAVDGNNVILSGFNGSRYTLYRANGAAGSFSAISGAPTAACPFGCIVADGDGRVYAGRSEYDSDTWTVTFGDSPNDPPYTAPLGTVVVGTTGPLGNGVEYIREIHPSEGTPDNCYHARTTVLYNDRFIEALSMDVFGNPQGMFKLQVEVDFPSPVTVLQAAMDITAFAENWSLPPLGSITWAGWILTYQNGDPEPDAPTIEAFGASDFEVWQPIIGSYSPERENVTRIRYYLNIANFSTSESLNTVVKLWMDNLYFMLGPVELPSIWRVSAYATSPDTDEITYAEESLPFGVWTPQAIAVDSVQPDNLIAFPRRGRVFPTGPRAVSTNNGNTWSGTTTTGGSSNFATALYRQGSFLLGAGISTVFQSQNLATGVASKKGNLGAVWSLATIPTIKQIWVIP